MPNSTLNSKSKFLKSLVHLPFFPSNDSKSLLSSLITAAFVCAVCRKCRIYLKLMLNSRLIQNHQSFIKVWYIYFFPSYASMMVRYWFLYIVQSQCGTFWEQVPNSKLNSKSKFQKSLAHLLFFILCQYDASTMF